MYSFMYLHKTFEFNKIEMKIDKIKNKVSKLGTNFLLVNNFFIRLEWEKKLKKKELDKMWKKNEVRKA